MSIQELWLLLPVLIISAGILAVMLQASWKRSHFTCAGHLPSHPVSSVSCVN